MRKLKFKNPVFEFGLNLTVRKGSKWHGKTGNVRLTDVNGSFKKRAIITTTMYGNYSDVTDEIVKYEHDPECRTVEGLTKAMKEAYPDFKETDDITLVFFRVDD